MIVLVTEWLSIRMVSFYRLFLMTMREDVTIVESSLATIIIQVVIWNGVLTVKVSLSLVVVWMRLRLTPARLLWYYRSIRQP